METTYYYYFGNQSEKTITKLSAKKLCLGRQLIITLNKLKDMSEEGAP